MIQVEDCFYLGYVKRVVGLSGELEIALDVDDPTKYKKKESMLLMIKNNLIPFFISHITIRSTSAIVKLNGVDSQAQAEELLSAEVYMPVSELPPIKGKNKFYYHEIIGYQAMDTSGNALGKVKDVIDQTIQPVMAIDLNGVEILIPLIDEFLVLVDKENKTITVSPPDGLIELYTKPNPIKHDPE